MESSSSKDEKLAGGGPKQNDLIKTWSLYLCLNVGKGFKRAVNVV